MRDHLSMALLYQKLGFFIFPVYSINENKLCSCGIHQCSSPGKHPIPHNGLHAATNDIEQINKWWGELYPKANIAIRTGRISNLVVLDIDPRNQGDESLKKLEEIHESIINTPECFTGGSGRHFYFEYPEDQEIHCQNHLWKGIDLKSENGYVIAPPSNHISGGVYFWEEFNHISFQALNNLPDWILIEIKNKTGRFSCAALTPAHEETPAASILEGNRNTFLTSLAGLMRSKGFCQNAIFAALKEENKSKCSPLLNEKEIFSIAKSIARYPHEVTQEQLAIHKDAFSGPIGSVIEKIAPHTESGKEALLTQLLVCLGNIYGNQAYYQVESTKLFPNLFCLIIGKSSWARKGTSWNHVNRFIRLPHSQSGTKVCDESWIENGTKSGLSSGEGLLFHLRDKGDDIDDEINKRITIIESEFSAVLKKISREGNVISQVIRDAWDSKDLSILTRNDPVHVSSPHISLIGHITEPELKKFLDGVEIFNGFANRFLWIYSIRSKLLPFGGNVESLNFDHEIQQIVKGKSIQGAITLASNAKTLWEDLYYDLSKERDNEIIDNIASRAPAQILKVSLVYALSEGRRFIDENDLLAAKAVWEYSELTSYKIFGKNIVNPIANKILTEMKTNQTPLNRTDIRNLFHRNAKKDDIERAKEFLINRGNIKIEKDGLMETWTLIQQ